VHGWIEPFLERADAAIEPGHIWSAQPIALPPRHALRIGRVNPKDDAKLDFKVVARGHGAYGHPPIHSLQLASDDAILLARATRDTPVVVLGGTAATAAAGELGDDGPHTGRHAMVVPLHAADRYDERTRRGAARYEFANAFYLPASGRPRFAESIARLDHVQPLPRAELTEHRGIRLSADALDALVEWFVAFTTDRLPGDSLIAAYRREQLAAGD
jgi:hypothetical protein